MNWMMSLQRLLKFLINRKIPTIIIPTDVIIFMSPSLLRYNRLQGIIERYPEGIASFVASDMKKYLKDEVEFFTLTILLKFFHYCQNDWKRFEQLLELEILPLVRHNIYHYYITLRTFSLYVSRLKRTLASLTSPSKYRINGQTNGNNEHWCKLLLLTLTSGLKSWFCPMVQRVMFQRKNYRKWRKLTRQRRRRR